MEDEVLTLAEAASLLKVSDTTVYQLTRSGELPARKVGREWRFLRSRLLAWLAEPGTAGAGAEPPAVVQLDAGGGEYKVENGQEYVALWLPMSREAKARQLDKASREGVKVSDVVAEYLRRWVED